MPFLDYNGLTTFWNKVKGILASKQNSLTAGEGVSLENDTVYIQEPVKGITQVEYDALAEEQKNTGLYVVTDANISLNDRGNVYSTEETRIGTWIDGKPLYRKVIKFTTPSSIGWIQSFGLSIAIDNAELVPSFTGYVVRNDGAGLNYLGTAEELRMSTEGNRFYIYFGENLYLNTPCIIIAEYTKTTDPTPTVSSVSTQSLSVNSLNSVSQAPEKVATSQVTLPSYATVAPASASSVNVIFAPASASSTNFKL